MSITGAHPEMLHPYDPRFTPQPIPEPDVCAAPTVTITMNQFWWSHVSGMIARLAYRDAWVGTDDEIDDAVEAIYKILDIGSKNMGCGCGNDGTLSRYTEDGDYQVSYDGGATWVDAPNQDPRNNVTLLPPPPIEGDIADEKCKAANSVVAMFKKHYQDDLSMISIGANTVDLLALITAFIATMGIPFIGAVAVLLGAIVALVASVTAEEFEGAFDDGFWDKLLCAVYCNIGDDLAFTDDQYHAVKSKMLTADALLSRTWIDKILYVAGAKGLTNAARAGALGTMSCAACECEDSCWAGWEIVTPTGQAFPWGTVIERTATTIKIQAVDASGAGAWRIQFANKTGSNHAWHIAEIFSGGIYAQKTTYLDDENFVFNLGTESVLPSVVNRGGLLADGGIFTLTFECI